MSKDALAGVYAEMLENDSFRDTVAAHPEVLADWDLTDDEKAALLEEASAEVSGSALGSGPAMSARRRPGVVAHGVGLAPRGAMNKAAGLPTGAMNGPGFLSNAACCPWGHAVIGNFGGNVM